MKLTFNLSEVERLAAGIKGAAQTISTTAAASLNRVAGMVRKDSVRQVISQVNLRKDYVDGKVQISKDATPSRLQAEIMVPDEPISLFNYGASQHTVSNVWTAATYAARFGSLDARIRPKAGAPSLPWTPRTGDQLRGIAAGNKAAGIRVGVKNGKTAALLKHTFTMPILSGRSFAGRWGAFSHTNGSDATKALYGPSVYQVTKGVWRVEEDRIGALLDSELSGTFTTIFTKALT